MLNCSPDLGIKTDSSGAAGPYLRIVLNWRKGLTQQAMLEMVQSQTGWELVTLKSPESTFADVGISDTLDHDIKKYSFPWILCSEFKNDKNIKKALDKGWKGCVSIESSWSEMVNSVKRVSAGHTHLCYKLSEMMTVPDEPLGRNDGPPRLTDRESEVLGLIARGLTSKEIGKSLGMSPHTVEAHRRNIKQKTGFHRVAELAVLALKTHGFLEVTKNLP